MTQLVLLLPTTITSVKNKSISYFSKFSDSLVFTLFFILRILRVNVLMRIIILQVKFKIMCNGNLMM